MQIIEFTADSLRFVDALPAQAPADGFVWVFLDRHAFEAQRVLLNEACQKIGGSALLDLHCQDLASAVHPSHYDYTSVYDLIIFRRLATQIEAEASVVADATAQAALSANGQADSERIKPVAKAHAKNASKLKSGLRAFQRIQSKAVGFAVYDKLLISVHPPGCYSAKNFIERFLSDAKFNADLSSARSRLPLSPADLVLRMVNAMVDSYLDLRKELTTQLEHWQHELLRPNSRFDNWGALMQARSQLHLLEDLCDEQRDAMQEWMDSLREQPQKIAQTLGVDPATEQKWVQSQHDQLIARARDVIEHIDRVVHHARRLEQSAETVVQIHFSAQGNRTNDIMRTLTALTAVFLPLNFLTGFFGMNFEFLPLIHTTYGFSVAAGLMVAIAVSLVLVFWRKRYLARTRG